MIGAILVVYAILGMIMALALYEACVLPSKDKFKNTIIYAACGPIVWVYLGMIALYKAATKWLEEGGEEE